MYANLFVNRLHIMRKETPGSAGFTFGKTIWPLNEITQFYNFISFQKRRQQKCNNTNCVVLELVEVGVVNVPLGMVRQFVHVLALGRKLPPKTSANTIWGCNENPNTGSSSTPVVNCKMCSNVKSPPLPPRKCIGYQNKTVT